MKVALLVPGGVDRSGTHRVIPVLLWLIERLAREVDLHVFALKQERRPARWQLLGAQIHNIGLRPRGVRTLTAVAREHARAPFDVLHAVWAQPGAAAALAGRILNVPVVLHLTGGDLSSMPELGFGLRRTSSGRMQLRIAARGAARITAPSTSMIKAAEHFDILAERLTFGVALDRWPTRLPRRRGVGEANRLIHVASLNRVKDQTTLLAAAKYLRDLGVPFHLDVVGHDTLGGELQRLAAQLGLSDAVTFHGFLPHDRLRFFMEHAHVHIVSSRHEGDPIALLEAAVAGVPTVGTNVGHLPEWAPEAALAVPVGDHAAIARAVRLLLEDEQLRLGIARAAQDRAIGEDADSTARRVLAIYREVIRS